MPDAKISIIVPVYKVEPYLRKCLDSIVGQTYQNLEIILVDDGSPDSCGAICDAYAARDERIRVIHKENGGLSSARNAALTLATGDYLGFVDSDDWAMVDMLEYLLQGALTWDADVAVCGRIEVYPDRQVPIGWEKEKFLHREQAIELLLGDSALQNYLCDKLWKRNLFSGITFPEKRNYEDVATTYKLFEKAEKIICLPQCKYFYLQRADGIVQDKSLKNLGDYYTAAKERYLDLGGRYPQFREKMEEELILSGVRTWGVCLQEQAAERRKYQTQLEEMATFVREHPAAAATLRQDLGLAGRCKLKLSQYPHWWAFILSRFVDMLYEIKHGRPI